MSDLFDHGADAQRARCAEDFPYFCETCITFNNLKRGLVSFVLHDFQRRYVRAIQDHRLVVGVKLRQGGFSTTNAAFIVWRLCFQRGESIGVVCNYDREACCMNGIVRGMIDRLPDWVRPEFSKVTDHELVTAGSFNRVWFFSARAGCGRSMDWFFVEEAAFIKDMDQRWTAMLPMIGTSGHCVVTSTTNGNKGWFYDTYTAALDGTNSFHAYRATYQEHPELQSPDRIAELKDNLGPRGFAQEMECQFLSPEEKLPKPPPAPEEDWRIGVSPAEETEILRQMRTRAVLHAKPPYDNSIRDNNDPIVLSHRISEGTGANAISFETLRPPHVRAYYWPDVAEEIAEEHIFTHDDHSLDECVAKKRQALAELEENVQRCSGQYAQKAHELLYLAGVGDKSDADDETASPADGASREILESVKATGRFPKTLELSLANKRLCVNGVATTIREFDLWCLYAGLSAFGTHELAVAKIAKMITKRISPLFGLSEADRKDNECQATACTSTSTISE